MSIKRSHYENAFEACLKARGIPCVSVEDVRHYAPKGSGLKLFDYIVYPTGGGAYLIDVKGRKSKVDIEDEPRRKTWVTRADIEGMTNWGEVFGAEYVPAFVFAYWLAEADSLLFPPSDTDDHFAYAGRLYSFWIVSLEDYSRHFKQLSKRWDTVTVPIESFREISRPLASVWLAAPC